MKKHFCVPLALAAVLSVGQAARADEVPFSFSDGSISTAGSFTVSSTPTVVDGVTALEVTGVSGYFNDATLGITANITGIYTPISYNTTPGIHCILDRRQFLRRPVLSRRKLSSRLPAAGPLSIFRGRFRRAGRAL